MPQNFDNYRGTPHGSPPPHANNDFTGLMGSLISPGLTTPTPLQQVYGMPYYNAPTWHDSGQGAFNYSVPFQGSPVNQDAWNQNRGGGYMGLGQHGEEGEDEDHDSLMVVDDTDILQNLRSDQQASQGGDISSHTQTTSHEPPLNLALPRNPTLSAPKDTSHPKFQGSTAPAPGLVIKSPTVNDSAARAAELRAKLLAKRPSTTASPRASPATKKADLPISTQTNDQELPQNEMRRTNTKAADGTKNSAQHVNAAAKTDEVSTIKTHEQSQGQPVKDDEFEHLFAQARNAANTTQPDSSLTNGNHTGTANLQKPPDPPTNDLKGTKPPVSDIRPPLQKVASSSEMSEGEIHSSPPSPTVARPSSVPTEAKEGKQVDEEKGEKLMRQDGVSKAYQPLKINKQPAIDPGKAVLQMPDRSRAEPLPSPKLSNKQLKQQAWKQRNGYAISHDVHADSRKDRDLDRDRYNNGRDDEKESKRSSTSQAAGNPSQIERDARRRPSDDELRRLQRTEDNARRAAEYKKNLEAQRIAASKKTSDNSKPLSSPTEARRQEAEPRALHTSKTLSDRDELGSAQLRNVGQMPTIESATGEQNTDTVMLSPTEQNIEEDEDISDWLELTEYYDLAHRERRLTWFRKKRALDIQRAELDREEQLELQERSMLKRSQSVLTTTTPPKVTRRTSIVHTKMPPPPLPIKEANNEGIKIKDAALSAGSSASQTPTHLKRPYAEDDVDSRRIQPADKIARTDLNGHATANEKPLTSPASLKGEGRGDRYVPRQGRSRSPGLGFRRRSSSPRRPPQRYSRSPSPPPYGYRVPAAIPRYLRTCHNCNQPGHAVSDCPESRRDSGGGKEWNHHRPNSNNNDYQQWVSPNYRGRNPVPGLRGGGGGGAGGGGGNRSPHHHPRGGGGAGNRARYDSIGRNEEEGTVGARENISVGSGGGNSVKVDDRR